jgi:hypothetical protein
MSATERNIQQLVELCRSRFGSFSEALATTAGLSNAMSATESNIQQLLLRLLSPPHEMRQLQVRSVKI